MPFFGGRQRPSQEEQEAAEVDLERIRGGGIPLGAEQRLRRIGESDTPLFTSDLSSKEYALAQASGLQPVAQVMGSSVVKHGYQNYGWANYNYGGITELTALSDPWNLSRSRAFGRLGQEAQLAGADAVIGIELTTNSVADNRSDVEYVVFGTAVRETTLAARPQSGPRLCALSGQDVDKLRRIGAEIRGVLGYTTVVCVTLSWQAGQAMRMWSGNQELIEITQGVYEARRLVMAEILRQAREVRRQRHRDLDAGPRHQSRRVRARRSGDTAHPHHHHARARHRDRARRARAPSHPTARADAVNRPSRLTTITREDPMPDYDPTSTEGLAEHATERLQMNARGLFTSDLSVNEYLCVEKADFEPVGLVVGSSIYHIGYQQSAFKSNQEMTVLTQAMYEARELAMTRMEEEADQLGADGIVGVRLDIGRYEWGADIAEFIAIGTAIKHKGGKIHRAPNGRPFTSDLSAKRSGR